MVLFKRYTIEQETHWDEKSYQLSIFIYDNTEKKRIPNIPLLITKYDTNNLLDLLKFYCDELNRIYEDDLLYLDVVNSYANVK